MTVKGPDSQQAEADFVLLLQPAEVCPLPSEPAVHGAWHPQMAPTLSSEAQGWNSDTGEVTCQPLLGGPSYHLPCFLHNEELLSIQLLMGLAL